VLAVTHLPQVAARGHQHLQVSKRVLDDQPSSTIRVLAQEERRDEVARMLGDEGTGDRALELAEELLRLAQS
jgi:DNA repair protein RecN (Recombination protein N)